MSFSALLPRVRRYAAAFTGSVSDGDQWIEAALTSLVEHRDQLHGDCRSARSKEADETFETEGASEFKDFLAVLHKTPRRDRFSGEGERCVAGKLGRLPIETRAAVLLHSLEGFQTGDIAEILGRSEPDVELMQRRGLASLFDPGLPLESDRAA